MIFGPFERMVAGRYLRARRREGFISIIAWFSLLGIALGVGTLIVVMSVMNGYRAEFMAQILGITLKAGCTKDDFDRTMAVHPTAAEELVTMYSPSYRVVDGERV